MSPEFVQLLTPFLPYLNGAAVTAESRLRDLGLDSMKSIDLLFAIEDTFGVSLPDEDLNDTTFATAGSLWGAVARAASPVGHELAETHSETLDRDTAVPA